LRSIASVFLFIFVSLVLSSCSESINEKFKTKSKIKPLFTPKTMNQKIGNGEYIVKKLKIPLTQDTIGSYDYAEILDDESLSDRDINALEGIWQGLRHGLYNMGIKLGVSNRVRYSADYDGLPNIDTDYIKSLKVKKIFFALSFNCKA
jgi:hypothetical protein